MIMYDWDKLVNRTYLGVWQAIRSNGPMFPVSDDYSVAYDVADSGGYVDPAHRGPASIREDETAACQRRGRRMSTG